MVATAPESHDVLDGIPGNDTDLPIDEHATDAHGATLALFDLIDKQLSPRIRDLGKATLYRKGPVSHFTARYLHVGQLCSSKRQQNALTSAIKQYGALRRTHHRRRPLPGR